MSTQVFDLQEYVGLLENQSDNLLFHTQDGNRLNNNQFHKLILHLKRKHKNLENFHQLRCTGAVFAFVAEGSFEMEDLVVLSATTELAVAEFFQIAVAFHPCHQNVPSSVLASAS